MMLSYYKLDKSRLAFKANIAKNASKYQMVVALVDIRIYNSGYLKNSGSISKELLDNLLKKEKKEKKKTERK